MSWSYFSTLPKIYRIPLTVVGIAALGTVFFVVFGYVVMWLWNHALVTVFDVPTVTFWQALGLFVLAKLFFGFGAGAQPAKPKDERHMKRRERSIATTEERMPDMDELFKQYWREEGKRAYEAYLAGKGSTGAPDDHA